MVEGELAAMKVVPELSSKYRLTRPSWKPSECSPLMLEQKRFAMRLVAFEGLAESQLLSYCFAASSVIASAEWLRPMRRWQLEVVVEARLDECCLTVPLAERSERSAARTVDERSVDAPGIVFVQSVVVYAAVELSSVA